MGLFLCDLCNEQLGSQSPHVCDPEKIRKRMRQLEDNACLTELRLGDIRNAVYMVLQSLPSFDGQQVTVETDWLRRLWQAADCQWYGAMSADNFLVRWMALHRILSEAFDVFRSRKNETLLKKLTELREMCDDAKMVMGYEDSKLDLTPEDLLREMPDV